MRRIGFVLNPIAGMGGRVGLKGTDGKVAEARERGAEPRAPERGLAALEALRERLPDAEILTCGDPMGEAETREAGFSPEVVYEPSGETTAADTRSAVRKLLDREADLLLFVGGDGTATDVAEAITEADGETPILGVPAGVKVYSSVFGVTPEDAGRIAAAFDATEPREVSDIDEEAYREGEVRTSLRAVVNVPVAEDLQSSKQLGGGSIEGLARGFASEVDPDTTYVLAPGSTVGAIEDELGIEGSPLGVDVWRDGELLVRDGGESEILAALGDRNVIVVSPIGGQGFVFGRGNQQLSPDVIRRCGIEIVASRSKLDETGVLRVDTGDPDLDAELRGWTRVRVGRVEHRLLQVV
ncbi:ATP-NAD kinase family protein [Halalkalicoccus sp. NIPERK01]|uniref:ATP-NAD kinase family protein n=1 Tax=Halalkalicoccus sp. NIPERK01 TaxID=3053469 RepID=UPI00256F6323|nr:ATP-NAD kinase family protein [Halalkalicoccus sp. NIPERK01]MDL5360353.1 ATP-NAD kinase family protein [Halalkalicoccus sp. NIPERK01]